MKPTLSLFVFIDAFGWDLLEEHRFLEAELPLRRPLTTELGYSSTCDPTILTGRPPREHGHFAFYYHDPVGSPFMALRPLRLLPRALTSRQRFRHRLSRWLQPRLGYTGYFALYNVPFRHIQLFSYSERRDLYEPGGILGGQPTVFDVWRATGVRSVRSDWRRGDDHNLAEMESAVARGDARAAYLYLAGMDGAMHTFGTRSDHTAAWIRRYESGIRRILDAAHGPYGEVRVHVFSDHGMSDVHTTLDLRPTLRGTGLTFGEDYVACFDSTMARFWFLRPGARGRVEAALARVEKGECMTRADLAEVGCDFEGDRYGELFFVTEPGTLICPSFMGARPMKGMHGYHPRHDATRAMYASNLVAEKPDSLRDLHDVMLRSAS